MNENITIIIPTYNRNILLNEVLPSYLNQAGVKEILIIDDSSLTPVSKTLTTALKNMNKIKIIRHNFSMGLCSARNTGIINTNTEYIFFGEDDLILSKNHMSDLLSEMKRLKADIIAGTLIQQENNETFNQAKERVKIKRKSIFHNNLISIDTQNIATPMELPFCHAIFMTETKLLKNNLFSTRIGGPSFYREDIELQLRLREKGKRLFVTPKATSLHYAKKKGYGSGTRLKNSTFIYILSTLVNTWQVIDQHYETIAPFFKKMTKKKMLRKAFIWTLIIEIKRWARSNFKWIDSIFNLIKKV